jgi:hypothetical protein
MASAYAVSGTTSPEFAVSGRTSPEHSAGSSLVDSKAIARAHSFAGVLGSAPSDDPAPASRAGRSRGAFYAGRFHNTVDTAANSAADAEPTDVGSNRARNPHWNAQRREIFSELRFDLPYFLWSTFYEILPTFLSGPLVRCLSNKAESQNRSFWPISPLDILLYFTIYWITYVSIAHPSANTSMYDALALWVYVFARGATIGVKYALYGDLDKDAKVGIRSVHYTHTGRQDKNLMSELCFNLHNKQITVLAENLYASCLKRDCDLSCATIQFPSAQQAQSMLQAASKILDTMRHVDREENILLQKAGILQRQHSPEEGVKVAGGSALDSHHTVLLNHKFAISATSSSTDRLRRRKIRPKDGATSEALSRDAKVSISHDRGLLRDLVRLDMEDIEKMARRAELPASIVALHCLSVTHYVAPKTGFRQFFSNVIIGLLCSFVPPLVRAIEGKAPFGETHSDKSVLGCSVVAFTFWFFIMVYYSMAPLVFFLRHLKVEMYLHRMLAGKWDEHSLQLKDEESFSDDDRSDGNDVSRDVSGADFSPGACPPPQIDLSVPSNVVGFAALRRVLHGGNFAPIIQKRFSFDLCVSVIAVFSDAMIQNFGSRFDAKSTTFASKVTSTVRLIILGSLIMPQIIVTWYINRFTDFHSLEIARGRLANLAMASEVASKGKAAELMRAAFFLESLETEVAADDRSNPVRAGIFRANLTLLSVLGSAIMGVLYFDLQSLLASIEGSASWDGGAAAGGAIANGTSTG